MVSLLDLWLPILLAAVGVFVVSSLIHMCLGWHSGDYGEMPAESQVLDSLRGGGVNPGQYMFPAPKSMKDMGSPEMIEKFKKGPVGFMIVNPTGVPQMGKQLLQWFLFSVLVGVLTAYTLSMAFDAGRDYMDVFRMASTVALAGYGIGTICDSIWKGISWGTTLKFVIDGFLYALTTAGIFASMWPAA